MSKRRLKALGEIILAGCLAIFPQSIHAQTAPVIPRAVIMDIGYVIENSKLGQLINTRMLLGQEALRKESDRISAELLKEENEIAGKRDSMESAQFVELAKNFEDKSEATRKDFSLKSQNLVEDAQAWTERFKQIVASESQYLVENNEVDMILNAQVVFAAKPSLDISPTMVGILDKKYTENAAYYEDILFAPVFPPIETAPDNQNGADSNSEKTPATEGKANDDAK